MATNKAAKKGITVPKSKTVSMRKYSELKAKYDALGNEHVSLIKRNVELQDLVSKQAEELKRLTTKQPADGQVMSASLGPIVNQEFIVLDKMVNLVTGLNPFQRRTVVAGFLSSIKERMKFEAKQRQDKANETSITNSFAQQDLREHENGMCAMAEIIGSFGVR